MTPHPPGEYAIVEFMGDVTIVGRIAETERFGTTLLAIEPIFRGELLQAVYHGGQSIYRVTPCSAETAFAKAPTSQYHLPAAVRVTLPPKLLADMEWERAVAFQEAAGEGRCNDDEIEF